MITMVTIVMLDGRTDGYITMCIYSIVIIVENTLLRINVIKLNTIFGKKLVLPYTLKISTAYNILLALSSQVVFIIPNTSI